MNQELINKQADTSGYVLEISHLKKSFGGHEVLKDVHFGVPEHTVFGFIGQNGAGKTTTMKAVLGLLKADAGEIRVCGETVTYGQTATNRYIGYLPDVPEFYGYMTPREYLTMCGEITGMPKEEIRTRSAELLTMVGLESAKKRIRGFSRGMKQRLGIAQALLNSPRLLICDEPTSALDPIGRKEILDILSEVRGKTTVIFSTHILSDVERICDRIAFLHKGEVALEGTLAQIREKRRGESMEIEFARGEDAAAWTELYPGAERIGAVRLLYKKKTQEEMLAMMGDLAKRGIPVQRVERMEPTLEDLFVEVAGE